MQRVIIFFTSLFLMSCASSPPDIRYFLLAEPQLEEINPELSRQVALGSVRLADFISGTGFVVQASAIEMNTTRQHRWGDRLDRQLERQFRQGMNQQFPQSQWVPLSSAGYVRAMDYRLDLYVDAFHLLGRQGNTQAKVRVQWFLRDAEEKQLQTGWVEQQIPVQGEGYAVAVQALSEAWQHSLIQLGQQLYQAMQ